MSINKKLINKLWYSHAVEYYKSIKKKKWAGSSCTDDKESFPRYIVKEKKQGTEQCIQYISHLYKRDGVEKI